MAQMILVTGGTGYVAGWAIADLLAQGFRVRTTLRSNLREQAVRDAVTKAGVQSDQLEFAIADLTCDEGWDAAMQGVDYVLHVASPLSGENIVADRYALVAPARDGTLRVLNAAVSAGVKRVVMTSAAATTRPPLNEDRPSVETNWADPEDPQFDAYRVSKILAEKAAWDFMKEHGAATEFATVLPGAVFGPILAPANQGSVDIIANLMKGRPPFMPKLGFWVVDVRDLVSLHIKAMLEPEAAGQRYLAVSEFMWMADVARVLREKLGAPAPKRELPTFVVKLLAPVMGRLRTLAPLVGRRFMVDGSKARRQLGFAPRPTADTIVDCAKSLSEFSSR